jgi:hypothetical protein
MAVRSEYGKREVEAAKRVLLELMQILGEYRESIVLIGGWVPYFLFGDMHIGSTDVDIALDRKRITDDVYRTIREHLESCGYNQGKQPFIFVKEITIDGGKPIAVQVDFLAEEYGGTDDSHRHQDVQADLKARKARGCELALRHSTKITIIGTMPDSSNNSVEVNMSEVVPFIIMKGMALYDRMKEKDAWDVYFCVKHFSGGITELAEQFRRIQSDKLVQEGLAKIRSKFRTTDDLGPSWVVKFEELQDKEEQERLRRDAYEQVNALLDLLDVRPWDENSEKKKGNMFGI